MPRSMSTVHSLIGKNIVENYKGFGIPKIRQNLKPMSRHCQAQTL